MKNLNKKAYMAVIVLIGSLSFVYQAYANYLYYDADNSYATFSNNVSAPNLYVTGKVGIGIGTAAPNNLIQVAGLVNFNNTLLSTSLGYRAGNVNTGMANTFVGYQAGFSNTYGEFNTANGVDSLYSNTTGYDNTANGVNSLYSNTAGIYNTANGMNSGRFIADGVTANQTSNNSLYLGYGTRALANGDTNEIVIGAGAVGNGNDSVTLGNVSITKTILRGNVGIGMTAPSGKLQVQDGTVIFSGTTGVTPVSGAGTRLMWIPAKAAFRAGSVSSDQWDDVKIGSYSVAMGQGVIASGNYSTAMGLTSTAPGYVSTAIGQNNQALGDNSTAIGTYAKASGLYSTAIGEHTSAESYVSTALGSYNVGGGNPSSWISTDPIFEIGIGDWWGSKPKANAMTVLKNGNVGIGTTNPGAKLQVIGDTKVVGASSGDFLRLRPGAAGTGAIIDVTNNAQALFAPLEFYGSRYNFNTGNVGIGTPTPNSKLTVAGTIESTSGGIKFPDATIQTTAYAGGSQLITAANVSSGAFGSNTGNGFYGLPNKVSIGYGASSTPSTIGQTGMLSVSDSVGIGTVSPTQKLDVAGNININTNGTNALFSTYRGPNSDGNNIWIGGGGQRSVYDGSSTSVGSGNTAVGINALYSNTTGYSNTANGVQALYTNSTGHFNTANGLRALYSNTIGLSNTANGMDALYSNTTGYFNTANGVDALYSNTTGSYNTANGVGAGDNDAVPLRTMSNSTFLGSGANSSVDGVTNSTAIGNGAQVTANNQVVIGNNAVTQTLLKGNVGIGTASSGYTLDVNGTFHIAAGNGSKIDLGNWGHVFTITDGVASRITFTTYRTTPSGVNRALISMYDENGTTPMVKLNSNGDSYLNGGNVGIGTPDPGYKLDVAGDLRVSGGGAFGGYAPSATHKLTTPTFYAEQAQIGNPAGGLKGAGSINASSVCIEGVCQNSWPGIGGTSGWTDDGAVIRLTTISDNVGIGTASPSAKLDVRNEALNNTAFQTLSTVFANVSNESSGETFDPAMSSFGLSFRRNWASGAASTNVAGIYGFSSAGWRGGMVFRTKNNTSPTGDTDINAMVLSPAGNVTIPGTVNAGSFSGPLSGTLNARNVSNGAFGSTSGNGSYGFPEKISIGYGAGTTPISLGQSATLLVSGNVTASTFTGNLSGIAASANLVNGLYTGGGGLQPPSYIPSGQVRFNMMDGVPGASGYKDWLMMDTYTGGDVPYVTMIGVSKASGSPTGYLAVGAKGGSTWISTPIITGSNIGSQSVNSALYVTGNNASYPVTAGDGNGLKLWNGSDSYKISMGVGGLYQYGPVTDYSIKTQMDAGSPGRGFTWGREGVAPIAALNSTSGNMQIAGTMTAGSFSGPMSGTLNSANVSAGAFGSNIGIGPYGFPDKISIGYGLGTTPLTLGQAETLLVSGTVKATTFSGALLGNATTATTFSTGRTNYKGVTDGAVAGELMWKNYGNSHTIFDASNSTAPNGAAVNSTNSTYAWAASYPTLMGWNGANTYGVRVDSARLADNITALAGTWWGTNYFGSNKGASSYVGGQSTYGLEAYSTDLGAAGMSFHRGGAYAVNLGLDPDNVLRIGGWSAPANRWQLDMSGNETLAGNLNAVNGNFSGNVGIGTTDLGANKLKVQGAAEVTGSLTVGGKLTVNGADVAEEFGTTEELVPGTVVVMGDDGIKTAKPCDKEYDKKVVGVVSDNPSIIMGKIADKVKAIVALTGVVKVKVTTQNGKIERGDLLVTSNLKGHAMKATEEKVGTIIGKALENFSGQTGEVTALINLQ